MEKLFIQNRKGQKVVVLVERAENQKGLAFVMHGLSGFKEQLHIEAFAHAFLENGFTAVRFDTTNTFGESDGDYADATTTNYYEDLEDVIDWASREEWYQEPFALAGHSLGGICIVLFAEKHSEKVLALAPISTVVAGRLSKEKYNPVELAAWEKSGWREERGIADPSLIKHLKWSHMVDRMQYDILPEAGKLTMPVLLIVGEKDESTPSVHQQMLFDALSGKKEFHIVKDAPHTFMTDEHIAEVKGIFLKWIDSLGKN